MVSSTKAVIFPALQSKMGSLFKPMLPLTHIHEQEPTIKSAKMMPPSSQTDSSFHPEFPPTTLLLTNGEPVWVISCIRRYGFSSLFLFFSLRIRILVSTITVISLCLCFDVYAQKKQNHEKFSFSADAPEEQEFWSFRRYAKNWISGTLISTVVSNQLCTLCGLPAFWQIVSCRPSEESI